MANDLRNLFFIYEDLFFFKHSKYPKEYLECFKNIKKFGLKIKTNLSIIILL